MAKYITYQWEKLTNMTAVNIKGNCEYLMAYKQYNYSYDIQNEQNSGTTENRLKLIITIVPLF